MTTIRLAISPCPNDTFMFDALLNGRIDCEGLRFEAEFHDIEELNRRAAAPGGAQVTKISTALWPRIADRYAMLDAGSALGRGNGQLLVRRTGDRSPIRRVAVPGERTTATAMLRRFYPELTDLTPMLFSRIAPAVAQGDFDAGVLIHEGRFTYASLGLELTADLGALWERETGLPLPLGAIVASRSLAAEVRAAVGRVLRRSIVHAFARPADSRPFVKAHAQELDDSVIDRHIALFVNDFSLSLGAEGARAVELLTGIGPDPQPAPVP